ncbi:hypothetical protein [Streptomyces sp. NPDC054849]
MPHPVRTRRLALFAATTAMAAGAVLVPTAAFAAAPAAPHAAVADRRDADADGHSTSPWTENRPGERGDGKGRKNGKWGGKRPGKGGSHGGAHVPEKPQWQCITAPCGPPGSTEDHRTPSG